MDVGKNGMKYLWLCIFVMLLACRAVALDYLEPNKHFPSPDKRWEVRVVKNPDTDDSTAEFYLAAHSSSHRRLLATNGRHFGAQWSPDSRVLLIYDNLGSGTSNTIVCCLTPGGWKKIYVTPTGFHIIWRLDGWLSNGIRLRSHKGGSGASKLPETITIRLKKQTG